MDIETLKNNVRAAVATLDRNSERLAGLDAQRNHVGNVSFYDKDGLYQGYVDFFRGEARVFGGDNE